MVNCSIRLPQRALIVVALVMLSKLFYRRLRPDIIFIWSLFLIALSQPLAVLGASFWLSFSAVSVLLLFFSPRVLVGAKRHSILAAQWVLFAGMAAPLVLFLGQISWLSILVNMFAVPLISLVTVPLCLLAGIGYFVWPSFAEVVWQWAGLSIAGMWYLFDYLPEDWGFFSFSIPTTGLVFLSMILAAFALLIPKGLLSRWLCLLPLVLLLLAHKPRVPLRLSVLDVGQGLAVIVEAQDKLMVYDTGPAYSKQFNAGSGVVAPFLRSRGVNRVEKLLISHGDKDHAGGFSGLTDTVEVKQALVTPGFFRDASELSKLSINIQKCHNSKRWAWPYYNPSTLDREWLYFDVLMPILEEPAQLLPDENNFSCVLLIRWRNKSILLTGDIEKSAESIFLQQYKLPPISVLVAPHHGSKTSSSRQFVDALKPQHVVFSAGFRHHFGHPHHLVVERYKASGARLWNTATEGGISFEWNKKGDLTIHTSRGDKPQFWWR